MPYVIRVVGVAGHATQATGEPPDGKYIESIDPDFRGGEGEAVLTNMLGRAKQFTSQAEALEYWRQQSTVMPTRPWDGRPNRPGTVFTVEVLTVAPS